MTSAAVSKEALRRAMRRQRAEIPVEQRRLASEALAKASRSLLLGLSAPIVSGYVPIRAEIDPGALMASMERDGARLALPRVEGDRLAFRLQLPGTPLVPGAYGIGEPAAGSPVVVPDLMLVPLLAFDRRGGRLGYGAGYYDRAITTMQPRLTVGLAFACQEVAAVPMETHDRRLDLILTEQGLIDCRRGAGA